MDPFKVDEDRVRKVTELLTSLCPQLSDRRVAVNRIASLMVWQ
jgi:hypothetical protein